jgi:hypothetical protein
MGISPIIYDPSLLGFPDFPTTNQQVFSTPTEGETFTVPSGVFWIGVKCWAAGGGRGESSGGAGCFAEILLEVYSGEILQIRVGGGGENGGYQNEGAGGINGGGDGGNGAGGGGGGGGYSGIFTNNRPLIMTGGGGGGGRTGSSDITGNGGGSGSNGGFIGSPSPNIGGKVAFIDSFQGSDGKSIFNGTGGGGGGGGFKSGEGGDGDSIVAYPGGSGLACAVLKDNMKNLIARRVKVFFIFSNGTPNISGYLGYGNGASITNSTNAGNGRIEITY